MKNVITILTAGLMWAMFLPTAFGQSSIPIRETTIFPDSVISSASALLPDGRVIAWGGTKLSPPPGGSGFWLSNKSYIYDPVQEVWTAGPDLNREVTEPLTVTLQNGNVMSIGGQGYFTIAGIDSFPQRTDHVEMYDVTMNQWVVVDSIPFGSSPYTGTSAIVIPDGRVWLTTTNGDYGLFDPGTSIWANLSGTMGPLDAGGRPLVVLDNGNIYHTGAGGQIWDISNSQITYLDPIVPQYAQGGRVIKLPDGRILTWDGGFSFSQEAIIVADNGASSMVTDSLVIAGQATSGKLMPNGEVWVFGFGEVGLGPKTLLQIFDPVNETWSSPGTYNFQPEVFTGYKLHLLKDSSLLVLTTSQTKSYRINAGSATGLQPGWQPLDWKIGYDSHQEILSLLPAATNGNETVSFTLMDLQGKTVIRKNRIDSETRVSVSTLAAGIYIARLLGEDGAWLSKKIRVD